MTLPGYFWDRWPYFAGKLSWDITTTQVNSALHPSGVATSSNSFGWGKGGKVTSAGWQVTLCDLILHVLSRSGVVISITNCYIRFTLLYFTLLTTYVGLPKELSKIACSYSTVDSTVTLGSFQIVVNSLPVANSSLMKMTLWTLLNLLLSSSTFTFCYTKAFGDIYMKHINLSLITFTQVRSVLLATTVGPRTSLLDALHRFNHCRQYDK